MIAHWVMGVGLLSCARPREAPWVGRSTQDRRAPFETAEVGVQGCGGSLGRDLS